MICGAGVVELLFEGSARMRARGTIHPIWHMMKMPSHIRTPTKMESLLKSRACLLEAIAAWYSPRSLCPRVWLSVWVRGKAYHNACMYMYYTMSCVWESTDSRDDTDLNRLYECNQRERHEAAEEGEYWHDKVVIRRRTLGSHITTLRGNRLVFISCNLYQKKYLCFIAC